MRDLGRKLAGLVRRVFCVMTGRHTWELAWRPGLRLSPVAAQELGRSQALGPVLCGTCDRPHPAGAR